VSLATPALEGATTPLPHGEVGTVYLHSGKFHVSAKPCRVSTILGSCVAVALFDPSTGVGGLNHFLLPHGAPAAPAQAARFGNLAVSHPGGCRGRRGQRRPEADLSDPRRNRVGAEPVR
jgi:hypothetical protein